MFIKYNTRLLVFINGILTMIVLMVVAVGFSRTDHSSTVDAEQVAGSRVNHATVSAPVSTGQSIQSIAPNSPKSILEYQQDLRRITSEGVNLVVKVRSEDIQTRIEPLQIREMVEQSSLLYHEIVQIKAESIEKSGWYTELEAIIALKGEAECFLDSGGLAFRLAIEFNQRLHTSPQRVLDVSHLIRYQPATDGTLAQKYIEVDKSLQRLFVWEGGFVRKSHIISTGKAGPTPNGNFYIKNHYQNAWSPIANVWTPFWMAFAYNHEIEAWLGFHELPYWEGENGEVIRRPFDTLGTPVTGGCIQLDIGDAEELYNWAEDGTLVHIHD